MNTEIIVPLLIETLAKSVLILSAAALIDRAWGRASAAQRHLVWCVAFAAVLLLPVTRVFEPRWNVPLQRVRVELPPEKPVELAVVESAPVAHVPAPPAPVAPRWRWPDWQHTTFFIWSAGAGLLLLTRLLGSVRLVILRRKTHPLLHVRVQQLAAGILRELGIRRRVELRFSPTGCVPLTWGTLRPVLMLPGEALAWSDARLTAALRHEAGHIARGDHFTRWIASLACAFYWPNPLVWFAARSLRSAQEQATDDLVLRAGSAPDEYAAQLFEVARTLAVRRGLAQCAVAMANPSTLERRMLAIVDEQRDRRPLSLRAVAGGVLTVVLTLGLATAAQLQAQEKAAPSGAEKPGDPKKRQIEIDAKFVEITSVEAQPDAATQWLTGVLTDGQGQKIETTVPSSSAAGAKLPTIQGIITPEQYSTVLRALSQKKGVDLMATPRVTTLSGQRAVIEIARDFSYPTKWEKAGTPPKPELRSSVEVEKEGQKWTPKAFETRKVGVTLEVLAEVLANGTISLQATPNVTEFMGFIDLDGDPNPPPDPADTITLRDKSGRMLEGDRPGRRMQPVFSERKLTSSVSIFPSQTVVIGNPNEPFGTTFAEATDGSKKQLYRQLLVFVTAQVLPPKAAAQPADTKIEPALERARRIILPKVEFRDATLTEALEFLGKKSRELDEEKQGVNLRAKPGAGDGVKITLSLANVPLIEAANYVAQLANAKFVAEGVSLIFLPADKSGPTKPAPEKPQVEENSQAAPASAAFEKAQKIILPKVEFREATVTEVVEFLRVKAREFDAEKQGVSMILKPGAGAEARMSLSLTNVPLTEVLRYVAGLTGLELKAEPYALVIQPPGNSAAHEPKPEVLGGPAALITRVWKVTEEVLRRALGTGESTAAIKAALIDRKVTFPEGSSLSWLPDSERLVMRNTQENLMWLEGLIEKAAGQEVR